MKKESIETLLKNQDQKTIIVLKLLSQSSSTEEKIFKFDKERIVLGSVLSADVRLTGDGVSPIHAVLEMSQDHGAGSLGATVFDLASDTGVFVNQKKVITHRVNDGDQITIGRHQLRFSLQKFDGNKKKSTKETGGRTLFLNPNEDLTPLLLEDEREVEEIFDFRPTSARALEVVMSWCGVILEVEHFIHEKSVTVGNSQKSDFGIPPLLTSSQYSIVIQRGGGFVLNLDSQMKGVMQKSGELKTLDDIRDNVMRGPQGYEVPIGNSDFAKISLGDIDFYFSFTAAPPKLKMRRIFDRDPFFLKIFLSSMALSAVAVFSLFNMEVPQNVEPEVPERLATILYQPEKFMTPPKPLPTPTPVPTPTPTPAPKPTPKEPPKPEVKPVSKVVVKPKPKASETKKPLPKVMDVSPETKKPKSQPSKSVSLTAHSHSHPKPGPQASAQQGEGARAKGAEGTRGDPTKKKTQMKVTEISRPSPNAGGKGASGNSQIQDEGNVDLLKGAGGKIQNILGNSAARFGEGSQELKGFGNFSTGGSGGLALSGSGHGGGGNADTTLGGLGKKGSGMGRVGTGKGAAGNASGIVGAHARIAIRTDGPEEAVVMGAIDRDAVADAIFAHKDEFRLCYEREINAENPHLAGQLSTSFVIGASGRVTQAGIESSSLNNANAERCVIKVLKRIEFPMPRGGGMVEVHFPFKFNSVGR